MPPFFQDSHNYLNRIKIFFKKQFFRKQGQKNKNPLPQRDYERFPMEFDVLVSFVDKNGTIHYDKAQLHDISGSGALFYTQMPDQYVVGQTLELKIYLAGTEDVRGCIKAKSSVVRIQEIKSEGPGDGPSRMGIAVKFQKAFEFERVDRNFWGALK